MEKSTRSFSLKRIISNDVTAGFSIGLVFVFWVIFLIFYYAGYMPVRDARHFVPFTGETLEGGAELTSFITLLAVPIFMWRVHFFHTLYKRGLEVSGIVTYDGSRRLDYEYMFQNKKYSSGNSVSGDIIKKRNYHDGDEVVLLIDPEKPKKAVIKDIYF